MNSKFCTYKRVGYLKQKIAEELGIEFTGVIYAAPGVLKHIMKRHGKNLDKKIGGGIVESMKIILDSPDYIGIYKKDDEKISIEFIKKMYINLLLGVELDFENQYIYVSTMYPINERKINNKLYLGKLIQVTNEKNIVLKERAY